MSTLAVKGRLADLTAKRDSLSDKMRAITRAIKDLCQEALIAKGAENVDANAIESFSGTLAELKREYRETVDLIKEVEREL